MVETTLPMRVMVSMMATPTPQVNVEMGMVGGSPNDVVLDE